MSKRGKGAHEKRLDRARLLRQAMTSELDLLRSGDRDIQDVLRTPSDVLGRCSVYDVLTHTPKLGRRGAQKLCEQLGLWPHDRLKSVPPEKRSMLIAALPERVKQSAPQDEE